MAAIIGRQFRVIGDIVTRLKPQQYSKKFVPPRKLTWQEKLYDFSETARKDTQVVKRRKTGGKSAS